MIELRSLIHDTIIYTKITDFFQPSPGIKGEKKTKNMNIGASTRFYPQPPGDFVDPFLNSESLNKDSKFHASKSKFIKKPFEQPIKTRSKKESRIHAKKNPPLIPFTSMHEYSAPGIPQEPVEEDEPKTETPSTTEKEKTNESSEKKDEKPETNESSTVKFDYLKNTSKDKNGGKSKIERTYSKPIDKDISDKAEQIFQAVDAPPKSAQYMNNKENKANENQ